MRVLKLVLDYDQFKLTEAVRHFVSTDSDPCGSAWLAEQLTAACQRRIDEVRAAAKGAQK